MPANSVVLACYCQEKCAEYLAPPFENLPRMREKGSRSFHVVQHAYNNAVLSAQDTPTPMKKPKKRAKRVILIELQKLFANLQRRETNSVSTTSLTESFGWRGNEVRVREWGARVGGWNVNEVRVWEGGTGMRCACGSAVRIRGAHNSISFVIRYVFCNACKGLCVT